MNGRRMQMRLPASERTAHAREGSEKCLCFEMLMKNIFLKFHFRLPSHKHTTINVFDICPIRFLVWITQKLFQKSGI